MRGDRLTRTLIVLTFVTGIVDAVSFLALGQVFAAMQTGNVIFLGLGVAAVAGAPLLAPLVALGSFLLGGSAALLLVRAAAGDPGEGLRRALPVEAGLLAAAAAFAALVDVASGGAAAYLTIGTLALAMGLRNTVARRGGNPNLATTVLNLTLSAFASQTPTGIAAEGELALRGAAIAAILAGAISGALLLQVTLALPLGCAAAVAVLASALAARDARARAAPA